MIRKMLVAVAAAVAIVAMASPASARPVSDPHTIYCGPGMYLQGATCHSVGVRHKGGTIGEWAIGIFGLAALAILF